LPSIHAITAKHRFPETFSFWETSTGVERVRRFRALAGPGKLASVTLHYLLHTLGAKVITVLEKPYSDSVRRIFMDKHGDISE